MLGGHPWTLHGYHEQFFFFNDPATTEIYPLSLHDALPIFLGEGLGTPDNSGQKPHAGVDQRDRRLRAALDRKSTRLNSSHLVISYAVFCLKKKTQTPLQHSP